MAETEIRTLPCSLTAEELSARSFDLARKTNEISALDAERKANAKDLGGQIDVLKAQCGSLAEQVETRHENRPVECDLIFHERACEVEVVRRDTGEIVTRRPMTVAEQQKALPIEFPGPKVVAQE